MYSKYHRHKRSTGVELEQVAADAMIQGGEKTAHKTRFWCYHTGRYDYQGDTVVTGWFDMPYRSFSTATAPYDHLPGFGPMGSGILRALHVIPGVTGGFFCAKHCARDLGPRGQGPPAGRIGA